MKKFVSFLMAVSLILPNLLPFQASAAEQDLSDYSQLIELAKETFPEYAEKLDGGHSARSNEPQSVTSDMSAVVKKTRAIDSNTIMTYTEYNNGMVTLGAARFKTDTQLIDEDSETYNTYTQYTATIIASVVEGPVFTATDVKYRIYPKNFDRIISAGNYGIPGYSNDKFVCSINNVETDTTAAYVSYSFPTPVGQSSYSGKVSFTIKNNVTSVDFYIW